MNDQDLITPPGLADLFCPGCGYNLRGIESDKCPECGVEVDRAALAESVIPWTRRAKIGRVKAFIQTVWLVTWHPASLARDMARPVSYRDAQLFRWIAVVLLAIPACGWTYYLVTRNDEFFLDLPKSIMDSVRSDQSPPWYLDVVMCWVKGMFCWPVPVGASLFLIISWTGVASYWFHPAKLHVIRQNRAIALSNYTCAPFVWLIIPTVIWMVGSHLDLFPTKPWTSLSIWGFADPIPAVAVRMLLFGAGFILVDWLYATLRLLRQVTNIGIAELIFLAAYLPLVCALPALLSMAFLPVAVGFVRLIIESYGA